MYPLGEYRRQKLRTSQSLEESTAGVARVRLKNSTPRQQRKPADDYD